MTFEMPPRQSEFWRIWALAFLFTAFLFALYVTHAHAGQVRASYYGAEMHGRTASGGPWRPLGLSVAHRTLPIGTRLRIRFQGRMAICPVTDRGPAAWTHRVLDLSQGCARAIGLERAGTGRVQFDRID